MPLLRSAAKAMLSEASRHKIRTYKTMITEASHREFHRCMTMSSYYATSPFKTRLSREMIGLELRKSEKPLLKLKGFEELHDSAWNGLETLAYQIVKRHRPKVIVELGTHMGLSALSMGLALKDLGEGGRLFAIDSWEGDPQAGQYGRLDDHVYRTFLGRCKELDLESTITPLKMYFDDALDKVDTPIDLLHIDGLHTWDAVNHDWATYGPLVRPGGLILFHDVHTHFEDLRKFWSGMTASFECHTVPYSHGLGIIRKQT